MFETTNQVITPWICSSHYLVGGLNLPLWKMMEWVRQLDDFPFPIQYMESHNPVMFQSPPTRSYGFPMVFLWFSGISPRNQPETNQRWPCWIAATRVVVALTHSKIFPQSGNSLCLPQKCHENWWIITETPPNYSTFFITETVFAKQIQSRLPRLVIYKLTISHSYVK